MRKILFILLAVVGLTSCGNSQRASAQTPDKTGQNDYVEVLYFHGKQRCITCNAIEKLTKEVVDSLKSDKVVMRVIDISKKKNEAIADKYEVTWSSLVLDRGGKVENLTDMGFGYAKNQPDVFKQKLTESITKLLK